MSALESKDKTSQQFIFFPQNILYHVKVPFATSYSSSFSRGVFLYIERRKKRMPFKGGEGIGLQYMTPEKRREVAKKSVEAQRKKREEKMQLQKCMSALLEMDVRTEKQKELLEAFGFKKEHTNKVLLMVSLFQKGITGDVTAIKEITAMMEKLDMYKDGGKVSGNVIINVTPVGSTYQITEEDEQLIKEAGKEEPLDFGDWETDTDDDWGSEIYEG